MNRILVSFAVSATFLLLGGFTSADAQTNRLGYINTQQILAEAPGTAEAQAAFEQDMSRYQAELQGLEAELQTLQDNFERQQATLTSAVRQQRQQEIQQKYIAFQQRQQELEVEAQERQSQLIGPIMQRIQQVIDQVRVDGGYSIIFDVAGGTSIVGVDPALDLTEQVLEGLQSAAPSAAP